MQLALKKAKPYNNGDGALHVLRVAGLMLARNDGASSLSIFSYTRTRPHNKPIKRNAQSCTCVRLCSY